jgi:hypothetical protein
MAITRSTWIKAPREWVVTIPSSHKAISTMIIVSSILYSPVRSQSNGYPMSRSATVTGQLACIGAKQRLSDILGAKGSLVCKPRH